MKKLLIAIFLLAVIGLVGAAVYIRKELQTPYPETASNVVLELSKGVRARDVVGLLHDKNVIRDRYTTLLYILYSGQRYKLKAGEYLFDRPMTPVEVVTKIVNGNVYLHKFTVPEGLTAVATSMRWEEEGFGASKDFVAASASSLNLISDLDPGATSLEGYLFPETYSFPKHTTAKQAIEAMVSRFRMMLDRLQKEVPMEAWPLPLRDTVILASMIEAEAAREEERPLVASVYLNRIARKILLQCDPTVIYALEQADQYNGRLTYADLKFKSPYNTYVYPGLPPGPIMNPGYPSLRAAIEPASTKYLYFVRTVEGKHTFSDNLAAHNRAVAAYRLLQRRKP